LKLFTIISPQVQENDKMSRRSTGKGSIAAEIILHCLLRWLGGESYLDIRLSAYISKAEFYSNMYKRMNAILDYKALAYKFPSTTKNH